MRFLLRRILHSGLLLVAASALSFIIVNLAPGDFYDALQLRTDVSLGTVSALRSQHGLNESLPRRYLSWVRSSIQGDWGLSLAYNGPAGPIVWSRAKNTFLLAGTATLLAWLVALPVGIWSAARSGTWTDSLATGGVSILLATPELVLALLLLLIAVRTGYFPAGGMTSIRLFRSCFGTSLDQGRRRGQTSFCCQAFVWPRDCCLYCFFMSERP